MGLRWTRGTAAALFGVIAAIAVVTAALAQPVQHSETGLAVTPPAGYVAQVDPKSGFTARIAVTRQGDANAVCFVDFSALPNSPVASLSQAQLNEMSRKLDHKAGMQGNFETRALEHLEQAGVVGAMLTGNFTRSPNLSSLLSIFYTPRGRTTVSCFSEPAAFEARRAEFVAVTRGITFPR